MKNNFFILIFIILIFPLTSSLGLEIIGNQSFSINKSINVNEVIIFQLINAHTETMYNISFEENDYIYMNEIGNLSAGQSVNVTAIVNGNANINQDFKIIGYYLNTIGVSNQTYEVDIYNTGAIPCDIQVIKGDTIKWNNQYSYEVQLDTGTESSPAIFLTIPTNESRSYTFLTPATLHYNIRHVFFLTNNYCTITGLSDTGLVHNPEYDTFIHLNLISSFDPTKISTTFVETSYITNVGNVYEGIFTIKNTGTNIAKNIHLSGEWMTFNVNDFDLIIGQTKGIVYYISPIISTTNDTDKTYYKNLSITGNFDKTFQEFDIFVNYADIDSGNYSTSMSLIDVILQYCNENPDEPICNSGDTIIVGEGNASQSFNVTFYEDQVKAIFKHMFSRDDEMTINMNFIKEAINSLNKDVNNITGTQTNMSENIRSLSENKDNLSSVLIGGIIIILMVPIISIMAYLGYYYKRKRKITKIKKGIVSE